jgi:hypothetical protein
MLELTFPLFKKTVKLFSEYQNYLENHSYEVNEYDEKGLLEFLPHPKGKFWNDMLSEAFKKEYLSLSEKNIYFLGCLPKLYIETYPIRLKNYIKESILGAEVDFIIGEYEKLSTYSYLDFLPDNLKDTIRLSLRKEKEYLTDKTRELGYRIVWNEVEGKIKYDYEKIETPTSNEELIDYFNEETAANKVIFLNELGILEYLNNRAKNGFSKNMVAKILSHITGENASTLQSYINPINNSTTDQGKSPYSSIKNVEKVKSKITQIGF